MYLTNIFINVFIVREHWKLFNQMPSRDQINCEALSIATGVFRELNLKTLSFIYIEESIRLFRHISYLADEEL